MSKLYDIVEKVINTESMIEAEQILYGKDGIVINSSEYYKNIISNFIQRKEIIIRKEKGDNGKTHLVFDLNNCNDLWNILFIYNYYIRYIDQKIELLNNEIKKCVIVQGTLKGEINKLKPTDSLYQDKRNEYSELSSNLNKLRQLKQNYENYKTKSLQQNIVELENVSNIDEDSLQVEIEKLKEAINCIQKMRDSLAHANKNLNIDSIVSINNPKNKFEISIPIEYLDGFNKGRIIAKEEDKVLVQQTNNISSPLLEALDFDIKKIDSFFYNFEPSYLEFLLEKVNYDVDKLYQLSPNIFYHENETKIFIKNGLDIFSISKLSDFAFQYVENILILKELGFDIYKLPYYVFVDIKRTMKLLKANIDVCKLSHDAFYHVENVIKLKELSVDIYKLPIDAFFNIENVVKLLDKNIDIYRLSFNSFNYVENTIKLFNAGINIYRLRYYAFQYAENIIKLNELNIDIYKLPDYALKYAESTIRLLKKGINIYKLPDYALEYVENIIKLNELNIDIYKLPHYALKYAENTIKLLKEGFDVYKLFDSDFLDVDFTIKLRTEFPDIYKLFYYGFADEEKNGIICLKMLSKNKSELPDYVLEIYKNIVELKKLSIDIYKLPYYAFMYVENTMKLFNAGINIYKLPHDAFQYAENTIKLNEVSIDIYKLNEVHFKYAEDIITLKKSLIDIFKIPVNFDFMVNVGDIIKLKKSGINIYKLPYYAFYNVESTIKLFNAGINVNGLSDFDLEYAENIIKLFELNIDVYKLLSDAFYNVESTIKLFNAGINIYKLPDKCFNSKVNIFNLKKILEKVDYEQLDILPYEFFVCNSDLLDSMFLKYNSNISKSIFGINNPKIVATLIYANNVLSNYNKNVSTIDMNIQTDLIITKTCDDCFKYKKNIEDNIGKSFASQDFLNQFKLTDENNIVRSENDIRGDFLTKIRNASEHFRFKLVRDNNGNILEDKIYIYDEDNKGINNFNLIIDLKDLVEIIREVEKEIELNNIYNSTKKR